MSSTSMGVDGATTLSLTSTEVFFPCEEVIIESTRIPFTSERNSLVVRRNSHFLNVVAHLVQGLLVEASNRSGLTSQALIKFEMVIKR